MSPFPITMIKAFRDFWAFVSGHGIWSKVVSWIICGALGAVGLKIYAIYQNINFAHAFSSIFNYKLSLWVVILIVAVSLIINNLLRKIKRTLPPPVDIPDHEPVPSSPQGKSPELFRTIFDIDLEDQSALVGFGQQDWFQNLGLHGNKGVGSLNLANHIITVNRPNKDGRYIITVKRLTYKGHEMEFIPKDLLAKNPRTFSFHFRARSISGKHKIVLVFRRPDYSWIEHRDFEVEPQNDWHRFGGNIPIKVNEEAIIEFHTWSSAPNSTFQICEFGVTLGFNEGSPDFSVKSN